MPRYRGKRGAFGAPGADPRWSPAAKQGIGTSVTLASRIWFTLWNGILTEVYYPDVDQPQIRDAQLLLIDDGDLIEEKSDFDHDVARIECSQGYRVASRNRKGRFSFTKEVITDPRRSAVLMRVQLEGDDAIFNGLRAYLLCAPHLEVGGQGNSGYVIEVGGRELLVAERKGRWMVMGASCAFTKLSCGYVGQSDGYTDLKANGRMTFEFDEAVDGNIALTAELDIKADRAFTVAIAFGETMPSATSALLQSLSGDFEQQHRVFLRHWRDASEQRAPLEPGSSDGGLLYRSSYNIVLAHEDKIFQGAFVASLTIPWGEVRNDENGKGGYHLVWARDMVQSALGLLAAGDTEAPLRVLIYLAARQQDDGGFAQNFWVDGTPYRDGNQLDETAFPVILAWRLKRENLLVNFDPCVMVKRAVNRLVLSGPVTGEERWEEIGGYSPSTLAAIVAALICAAELEKNLGRPETAAFLESYSDYLVAHLEEWTVCSRGYFVRVNPAKGGEVALPGSVDRAMVKLTGKKPDEPDTFPASEIVDAGFLQLVRYGIFDPLDPVIVRSLKKVDADLKKITPKGPCWRRYTHDGYGQRADGGAYEQWGTGRSWPLLAGERAHYELAAGGDYHSLIAAMEGFSGPTQLLPEQIWDEADLPDARMFSGGPTGSAVPLVWAHSEYLRLLRSVKEGKVFDLIPEVARRYSGQPRKTNIEFWMHNHPISRARKDCLLRVCAAAPFRLRWSSNGWGDWQDGDSRASGIGAEFFDLPAEALVAGVDFTLFWKDREQWDGRDYRVEAEQ